MRSRGLASFAIAVLIVCARAMAEAPEAAAARAVIETPSGLPTEELLSCTIKGISNCFILSSVKVK